MKRRKKTLYVLLRLAIAAALVFGIVRWAGGDEAEVRAGERSLDALMAFEPADGLPNYVNLMLEGGMTADTGLPEIPFAATGYSGASEDADLAADGGVLSWKNEKGWVEWRFRAERAGWYELHMGYKPLPGGNASAVRGIQIDGAYPFAEAQRIEFERMFKDSKYPYDTNEIGQQIRPTQTEITEWIEGPMVHFAASSEPLLFKLEAGEHTIRLTGVREGLALSDLSFRAPKPLPDYEAYQAALPAGDASPAPWFELLEAERVDRKSSVAIQTDYWSEPYISPDPKGRITYNVLGGWRWRLPGEWAEWDFSVPADGWYEIDLKSFQDYRNGFKAYRTISIDGEVPFRELSGYGVPNEKSFVIHPLSGEDGEPYRIYLDAGKHTLRLTSDSTPLQPVFLALKAALADLADYDREIRLLTGNYSKSSFDANIDSTRTWNMRSLDPEVEARMAGFIERMNGIRDYIDGLNGRDSDLSQSLRASIGILEELAKDVDEIPVKINNFSTIQNKIGTLLSTLTHQPLLLDYIVVRTPVTETGLKTSTLASRIPYAITEFARSFYLDYDTRAHNKKEALTIWVQRGRDYAELLRELVDQEFTPRTGIPVNINLMPNPNMLILGNAAGEVPDVALGVAESTPADFAMRNAAYDLSSFPDYEEVLERFAPGTARALMYDGGLYGLPEVQNFQVLFYRTDVLEGLGLSVPDTWEDMFDMLPTLQENGMTMSYPKADFATIFFQHGAEVYSPDGLNGQLTSPEAQEAFRMWTDLYVKHNLPIDVPAFFQHFRDGDIPLGIADFNTYVQLQVAAPEITGHWGIAPLPGVKNDEGVVERWSPQALSAGMIMEKSERKDEAWEFLKWWTSDEIQTRYASDLESYYGLEFRWNTANLKAMQSLVWPSGDVETLREQARWAKNMPYVPGYYFLTREMEFAWNRTVLEAMPAQESLEEAQLSLQREMRRRQKDFGIEDGHNLDIPQLTTPYEWKEGDE
ncbi:extracellular solute-binding protein [Paenibacillus sp. LHD-117]|uniref:extracellular solute-binding protein n=1 Tax=Paenibacillus sp. LHD-117 TaxID=3071412 RepID=UPI0027E12B31|nr:extracellular solute-binding protein [Paenibacillus sp. LHD-117]MDQ6417814.1 extracellular solute-binding protein [Paenibacillus sp. LHD-117]